MKISPMDPGLRWLWDHLPCLNLQAKSNQMRSTSLLHTCAPIHKPFKSFRCWSLNLVWRLMALIRENRYTPNFRPYKSTVLHRTPVEESIHFMPKQTYCFSRTLRPAMFFPLNLFLSETVSPRSLNFFLSPRWQQSDHSPSCWTALGCRAGFIAVMVERLLYTEWDSTKVQSSGA